MTNTILDLKGSIAIISWEDHVSEIAFTFMSRLWDKNMKVGVLVDLRKREVNLDNLEKFENIFIDLTNNTNQEQHVETLLKYFIKLQFVPKNIIFIDRHGYCSFLKLIKSLKNKSRVFTINPMDYDYLDEIKEL